ncbi:MAG: DEAD/DEAH box helicase [Christensenellaceae bacterium]|nr:DEAD/DEAH box helicase [Christensenellaceae bacterium]MEA5065247.1 DEAD/DEAH box helicase [Eubacteriales bacterium]MEA5068044.1 DEAD/DEAH box helicase [Christensenellaceae bacterium]
MNLAQYVEQLRRDERFMENVAAWRDIPARPARFLDFPEWADARVVEVLSARGIHQLYSHQRHAVDAAHAGRHLVVVTPTASGKTLCYNLPVLSAILSDPDARALYLFPTKALSSDQVAELYSVIEALGEDIKAYTYDGDTPAPARTAIRQAGHVVVTNPDMLHSGILPHHTKWVKLFENLKYIVIDEVHAYRGVFGSNLAGVLRRLSRICAFYGSQPTFICCSATIQNPKELAERLTGRDMLLIDDNGAPAGVKHVVFYNPPVVNRQLGIRKGAANEAVSLTRDLIANGIQTIVFARARVTVEVLVRRLKDAVRDPLGESGRVRGYRGGYLPTLRRQIERALRSGEVDCVVSTNALELGIDIGQLEACVLCGYPGTIASTWQQAGRAGRRSAESLLIVVATSGPLDQYMCAHPEFFFGASPERAYINPDNLYILLNHLKCAAYELPFDDGELFALNPSTGELLTYLAEQYILRKVQGRYYWMAEEFPQAGINLRSASDENFVIVEITRPEAHRVIGEMDRYTVPMLLHEQAIYLHEGRQYQVERLDFDNKKAYVRAVDVDYYTDADLSTSLKVLYDTEEAPLGQLVKHRGEVLLSSMVTLFKKMKLDTGENLGWGPVTLPELEMHTSACWWTLPDALAERYGRDGLQDAMVGLAHLMRHLAPAYLMCAPSDIHVSYHVRDPFTERPTLYLSDSTPGGLGLSDRIYEMDMTLFTEALERLSDCPCASGCPGCVGAAASNEAKARLKELLTELCAAT